MKTVHLIETFQELCHAFADVRSAGDTIPSIESKVKLHCNFGDLEFTEKSNLFAIADDLKPKASEFLRFLISSPNYIPTNRLLIDEKFES